MSISPELDAHNSSSPFPQCSANSATPFADAAPECRGAILIVEDDIDLSEQLDAELHRIGCETAQAFSGEEARTILETRSFSLILLDWRLPRCSGLDVA